jgi:CubicO group peptidase (beta-lactamase class C family)
LDRPSDEKGATRAAQGFSRRAFFKDAAAAGLVAASANSLWRLNGLAAAGSPGSVVPADWQQFDSAIQDAMQTFGMVGVAVAVVNTAGTLYQNTFGVRDLASGAAVTPQTLFRIGSLTKSLTSMLAATFVDGGTVSWDQRVKEVWPDFRTPNDELTKALRVRDLLGMDTGLGETAASGAHYDYPTALEVLQSLAFLPVLNPPYTEWFYNNPVYTSGGYVPLLGYGVSAEDLLPAYSQKMQERVFGPAGMVSARIADDPRPYTDDYATGHTVDFVEGVAAVPWASIGNLAPTGGALANLADMATYVRLQLGRGVSTTGTRVVSATNLMECWRPHIDVPMTPTDGPDLVRASYGMGWFPYTYVNDRRLIWHSGFYDGFGSFAGFLPDDNLGLIVLSNMSVTSTDYFYRYVLNLLLNKSFGISAAGNDAAVAAYQSGTGHLSDLAAQAGPVDRTAIAPFLGYFNHGYRLSFDAGGALRLRFGARAPRIMAMPDGSYVEASGPFVGTGIRFSTDGYGRPKMAIEDAENLIWEGGLE